MSLLRPTALKRALFFIGLDILVSLFTLYFAYALRFNFSIPENFLDSFWLVFSVLIALKISIFYLFRLYSFVWRFFGFHEAKSIVYAHLIVYTVFVGIYLAFEEHFAPFARSIIIIDLFLSLMFLGALRASKRVFLEGRQSREIKPAIILGADSKAATIVQSAIRGDIDYYPQAIISLDGGEMTKNAYISNVKVYQYEQLNEVVSKTAASSAIITKELSQTKLKQLVDDLNSAGVKDIKRVKILGSEHERLEDLSIEDLLARRPKDLDSQAISEFIKNRSVLITGAGGSIGSEIAKQCHKYSASKLILVDNSEFNLYMIGETLPDADLKLVDITDAAIVDRLLADAKPDIVIHAAAYKHVPICEANQDMAVRNNVLGSKNIIDMSIKHEVGKLVIISTDKAVRPTNVMGATKRVVELYAGNVDSKVTEIAAVRFGNVLGSSGSVIPKFKQQIEEGGPVTVTDPQINRYFMLIPEACQLVLQAAAIAKGGELFVLDMGEPVRIMDLAKQMIRLYGKEDEIEIEITGLRPGEKLYEELLIDDSDARTKYSSIFVTTSTLYDIEELNRDISHLLKSNDKVESLKKIVPEFITPTGK